MGNFREDIKVDLGKRYKDIETVELDKVIETLANIEGRYNKREEKDRIIDMGNFMKYILEKGFNNVTVAIKLKEEHYMKRKKFEFEQMDSEIATEVFMKMLSTEVEQEDEKRKIEVIEDINHIINCYDEASYVVSELRNKKYVQTGEEIR